MCSRVGAKYVEGCTSVDILKNKNIVFIYFMQ